MKKFYLIVFSILFLFSNSNAETFTAALKKAYDTKDISKIEPALEKMNEAWKSASEEMYKAQQNQQANGKEGSSNSGKKDNDENAENVEDVDFEEVKE